MSDVYMQTNERSNTLTAISLGSLCVIGVFAILPALQGLGRLTATSTPIPIITAKNLIPKPIIDLIEPETKKTIDEDVILEKPLPPLTLIEMETLLNPGNAGVGIGAGLEDIYNQLDTSIPEYQLIDLDKAPRVLVAVKPLYPYSMKGISGKVMVEFVIDKNGKVLRARVTESTSYEFNQAAIQAVKKSKWKPGEIAGKAVRTIVKLPIDFKK